MSRTHIRITWIKGHATDADREEGNSTIAHLKGNNETDTLANAGSKLIALPDLLFSGTPAREKDCYSVAGHVRRLL